MELSARSYFWAAIAVEVIAVGIGAWIGKEAGMVIAFLGVFFFLPAINEWREKRRSAKKLETNSESVEMKYDPTNPSFVFEDVTQHGHDVIYYKWCRVAAHNKRDEPQTIKVEITGMRPCPNNFTGRFPLAMHIKDDNTQPFSQSIAVAGKDHQFFDIVSYQFHSEGKRDAFVLQHAVAGVGQEFEPRDYKITLEAIGETSSHPRAFLIGMGKDRKFYMKATKL